MSKKGKLVILMNFTLQWLLRLKVELKEMSLCEKYSRPLLPRCRWLNHDDETQWSKEWKLLGTKENFSYALLMILQLYSIRKKRKKRKYKRKIKTNVDSIIITVLVWENKKKKTKQNAHVAIVTKTNILIEKKY